MKRLLSAVLLCFLATSCGDGTSVKTSVAAPVGKSASPNGPPLQLVLLGTGTPIPETASSGPAAAIIAGDQALLVDAGAGVVRRAQAAYERGISALRPDALGIIFLTHLHSDHTLGLPDVLFTPWIIGRRGGVDVFGPQGTRTMVDHLLAAWQQDIHVRETAESQESVASSVRVHEIREGIVYSRNGVTVRAFRVSHGDFPHAFGFRFDSGRDEIVISGDTAPDDRIARMCDGCDILLHEVYCEQGFRKGPPDWQKYHAAFHTSGVQLARIAMEARPGKLVLTHLLRFGCTDAMLQDEVTAGYDGEVVLGHDLDVVTIDSASVIR